MPVPAPLTSPPPSVEQLVDVLAALGQHVTISAGTPQQTALHLSRLLVAAAERHAVAAELALRPAGLDGHDVDDYQDTYDTATVRATFERLALAHWRARRLSATVTGLRDTLSGADTSGDEPSGLEQVLNLAVHATIAADAVIAVLATLITPPADDTAAAVERLDAATALLVRAGQTADELRAAIGMDAIHRPSGSPG